ncbi:MAG: hypothetical protein HZB61_12725 [Nitrospirae bacterium]|nr:hypothetical protein [Nitrospirota bacterium]
MITRLSDINCSRFDVNLFTDLKYFNVDKFLKDNPLRKEGTKKNFVEGKLRFGKVIVLEKADYHIHLGVNILPTKSSKKVIIDLEFCLNKVHGKSKTGKIKKLTKGSYFESLEGFVQWLRSYFTESLKVESKSFIIFNFKKDKYKPLLELPFKITVPTIEEVELGDVSISGVFLDFKNAKFGVDNVIISLHKEGLVVTIVNSVKPFDEHYFANTLESSSKFVKIFIRESENNGTI